MPQTTPRELWYPKVVVIARGDVLHVLVVYSGGTFSLMCPKTVPGEILSIENANPTVYLARSDDRRNY